jgi:hypothetical protein
MAGFNSNLRNAKQAVVYSQKTLTAANYLLSNENECDAVVRCRAWIKAGQANKDRTDRVAEMALHCEKTGAGNRVEFAALCFIWAKRRGVYPIDFMSVTNGNHCFVVIGRKLDSDHRKVSSWGAEAVIVDGWDNNAYQASWGNVVSTLPGARYPEYESNARWSPLE